MQNACIILIRHVKCMRYLIHHVKYMRILFRHVKCMRYLIHHVKCMRILFCHVKCMHYFNSPSKMCQLILSPKKRHNIQWIANICYFYILFL